MASSPAISLPGALVVRHTESLKTLNRLNGGPGMPLTEQGVADAKALASFLSTNTGLKAAKLVTAPMRQTRETAELLGEALGSDIEVDENFRGLRMGLFDGLSDADCQAKDPASFRTLMEWRKGLIYNDQLSIPDIESVEPFLSRIYAGVSVHLSGLGIAIFVCSRSTANAIVAILRNPSLRANQRYRRERFDPGSISEFVNKEGKFVEVLSNWTGYLSGSRVCLDD